MSNPTLRITTIALTLAALASSLLACVPVQPRGASGVPDAAAGRAATPDADDRERPAGWREASHSNDVAPNYDVVFPIDAVNTLTITIAPDDGCWRPHRRPLGGGGFNLRHVRLHGRPITFQGQDWTHVGVRYKGGSSLSPWKDGELRLPFKFDSTSSRTTTLRSRISVSLASSSLRSPTTIWTPPACATR